MITSGIGLEVAARLVGEGRRATFDWHFRFLIIELISKLSPSGQE